MIQYTEHLVTFVELRAKHQDERLGQALFNSIPAWGAEVIRASLWDPFHRRMDRDDVIQWIEDHIIFNSDGYIVAIMNGNTILVTMPEED
jgi:hypothetical protein